MREVFNELLKFAVWSAQAAGEPYHQWSEEITKKTIFKRREQMSKAFPKDLDLSKLTRQEMFSLGFGNWDGEYLLIPIWLFRILPSDTSVICPVGGGYEEGTVSEVDDDIRGGCVAWALKCNPKGNEEEK